MNFIDANALIALVDERDELNKRALTDKQKLRNKSLWITEAVLSETCYTLSN